MKNSMHSKSRKRLTSSTLSGVLEDRISDLPDSVIQHILSFLDAKNAIKTCVLSRRWEFLWTSIPNLVFHCNTWIEEKYHRFAAFVDKTLMKHTSSKIKKFSLSFCSDYTLKDQVDSWLLFAINHNVEELCLRWIYQFCCSRLYKWPECMYSNSCVTRMSLHSLWLDEGLEDFYWTSLKVLILKYSILRKETIRSILLGSPLIESLTLRRCKQRDGRRSIIDSSCTNLKELVIDDHQTERDDMQIDILAPNLLSLAIVGCGEEVKFNLVDVSSLVEAKVEFYFYMGLGKLSYELEKKMLMQLIQDFSHVDELTIGIWCYHYKECFIRKGILANFPTVTRKILEINMVSTKGYLPGLLALLCNSPDLEQLTIHLMPLDYDERQGYIAKKPSRPAIENFAIQHLKHVSISGFVVGSRLSSNKVLIKMVRYFLANAMVLQELIIYAEVDRLTFGRAKTLRKLYEITQELLSYPRASPDAVVVLRNLMQ